MSNPSDQSWMARLLSMGLRSDQMSSALNQPGSMQQEAYVRHLLKETRQKRVDLETPLSEITFIVLDTETTGFQVNEDEIFAFSAAKIKSGKLMATYSTLLQPNQKLPPLISDLTGIRQEDVDHAPYMADVIHTMLDFLTSGVIVGYHITHDLTFLNTYLKQTNQKKLPHQSFELRQIMEHTYQSPFPMLDDALLFLDIQCTERHSADGDVKAMTQVWEKLYQRFHALHVSTLYDLYALVGSN